jgi:hypothetical protein
LIFLAEQISTGVDSCQARICQVVKQLLYNPNDSVCKLEKKKYCVHGYCTNDVHEICGDYCLSHEVEK